MDRRHTTLPLSFSFKKAAAAKNGTSFLLLARGSDPSIDRLEAISQKIQKEEEEERNSVDKLNENSIPSSKNGSASMKTSSISLPITIISPTLLLFLRLLWPHFPLLTLFFPILFSTPSLLPSFFLFFFPQPQFGFDVKERGGEREPLWEFAIWLQSFSLPLEVKKVAMV